MTIEDGSMVEDCAVAEVGATPEEGAVFVDGVILEAGLSSSLRRISDERFVEFIASVYLPQ